MWNEIRRDAYDITVRTAGDRYRAFLFDHDVPTLVDTGFADTVEELTAAVSEIGVTPERVIVTHGDPDHVGGLAAVRSRYDLETWVPEGLDLEGNSPDRRYEHGDRIGRFTAVHTPGHTAHHHSLVDEEAEIVVMGDAVFGSSARGLPGDYFVLPPGVYTEDLNRADESLSALLDYEFDVGLVFHGEHVTTDAREKLERFVDFAGRP